MAPLKGNKGLQGGEQDAAAQAVMPRQREDSAWDAGVEISGPAQMECTVNAVLELKHMTHIHTCYQHRIGNSDVSQSQHTQSSLSLPFIVGFSSY